MLPRRPGYLGPGSLRGFLPPKDASRRLLDSKYLQNTQASTIDTVWVIFLRRPAPPQIRNPLLRYGQFNYHFR